MAKVAVGVDIGGTNLRFGLVSDVGAILARKRTAARVVQGPEGVFGRIADGISAMLKRAAEDGHVPVGIGLGVPGIISAAEGVVRFSPNLPGWADFPLKGRAQGRFPLPAVVENDANAYALGEAWLGSGAGASSLVCITLGTGVGGGIILGGDVWRGVDGMAGEVGHLTVNPRGPLCGCGNRGCLERYASATAVVERAGAALVKGSDSTLRAAFDRDPNGLTADMVRDAAERGDALSAKVYREAGVNLGIALSGLINLLNVERIVIGGGMAGAWDLFIGPLEAEIKKRAFRIPRERCAIVKAKLGDDAAVLGAAGLVFKSLAK